MLRFGLVILLSIFTINAQARVKQSAEIDAIFADWDNKQSPGAALGVIKNGELIYSRGYGMANLEYAIPNTKTSVFRIASTSKQFTAASIILLVQSGKVSLEDPLINFFPEFPAYAKSITVQHLLNHTSGIRDYLSLAYLAGLQENDHYTDKEVLQWLVNQETINFNPGDKYLYSNSGYWLLGKIVEKVTSENMAEFAKKEIFEPLNMHNTHFHNNHNQIVKNRASGYSPTEEGFRIDMTTLDMIGDGGIFTTIEDMKKWDDAYYDSDVLNAEFWQMMTQAGKLNNGKSINYASGLGVEKYKGLNTISHGGSFVGYRAEYIKFPDQKFAVILFANRSDAAPSIKARKVADLFLSKLYDDEQSQNHSSAKKLVPVKLSEKQLKQWTGDYWYTEASFARKIAFKDNALFYQRNESSENRLVPVSETRFTFEDNQNILLAFNRNDDGLPSLSFSNNGEKPDVAVFFRKKNHTRQELESFVGHYYSKELLTTYEIKLKDNKLALFINEKPAHYFESVKDNILVNPQYGAFYFHPQESGNIGSFTLSAGRVRNLTFIKR